jgi:hypothetical protein
MKINIKGKPDDLIKRCSRCKYCIFEDILAPEQRKIKVLKGKNPKKHIHRLVIEQLCGKLYDGICPMKYAAMKATVDDRTAMQMGVVKIFIWDLGKKYKKEVKYNQAMREWTENGYAKKYDLIWKKGIRKVVEDGEIIEKQIFTSDLIYAFVAAKPKTYHNITKLLEFLIKEHEERDRL